ncbi:MAG: DUF5915 domain-containing protein, partial [Halobacteriales archaeon]|nr:DUF5915 domain-containing protein [Halobacteriales archaeon]
AGERWEGLAWQAQPDRTKLGPAFKGLAPKVTEALKAQPALELRAALEAGPYPLDVDGQQASITADMVKFASTLPEGVVGSDFDGGSVYLDTHITPELAAEGLAREIVRRVQEMRKEAKLERGQAIRTELRLDPQRAAQLQPHLARIAEQTRSASLTLSDSPTGKHVKEWDIEGEQVTIAIG